MVPLVVLPLVGLACGDDAFLLERDNPVVESVAPAPREGTWQEIGPGIGVVLNFFVEPPLPNGDPIALERLVSFELDDRELLGRPDGPRVELPQGTPYTNVTVEIDDLGPGRHEARVVFVDNALSRRSVDWTWRVLDEFEAPFRFPTQVADYLTVVPSLRARGSWTELGPRIGFRLQPGAEFGFFWNFAINHESVLDQLSCDQHSPVLDCGIQFEFLPAGRYVARLSYSKPPDDLEVLRVQWDFTVTPR